MTACSKRLLLLKLISACLLYCLQNSRAAADMGRMILSEQQGDTRISVFVSPDPLRAGPIDISVLLQYSETGQPIDDAEVNLRITPSDDRGPAIYSNATQAAATNKLLRAALLDLPNLGSWDVEINYIAHNTPAHQVEFTLQAGPPLAQWFTLWPWFTWPAAVVLLFGIHCRLAVGTRYRSRSDLMRPGPG
jgi:hypothetical protein